ncbi:hypothetical protein J3R75_001375 [Oligosphaera ethanolica]|uniref:Uncharacterized protein n=1 Tax=Oligosphaera ethanolica TaxID=760260 RepID=A0AAE3VFE7_9BACT|nr:hypothetical protein [Oligosphaera ethanolica]
MINGKLPNIPPPYPLGNRKKCTERQKRRRHSFLIDRTDRTDRTDQST